MTSIKVRWAIHASIAAVLFAVPYKYWLTTPVLQYISIGHWRLLAALVAAAFGGALSLVRVSTTALSFGAMAGLLIGGGLAVWKAPHDVAMSLYGAFASHVESFWRELIVLKTAATLAATLAASCYKYFRNRGANVR